MRLTKDELRAFADDYLALLRRYERAPEAAPLDARPVTALFAAFPTRPAE